MKLDKFLKIYKFIFLIIYLIINALFTYILIDDIKISNEDGGFMLYSKVSQEKSGGETQTPFYITIAASFMQLYRNSIGGDSIGLVMMDEAFNNMDDERIAGVLSFMSNSNLQMIIAAPPDKIQYIGPAMKKVLLVLQDDKLSYVEDFSREAV